MMSDARNIPSRRRVAMTLIEVVAAMVIATMVLCSAMAVLGNLSRLEQKSLASAQAALGREGVLETINDDLFHAQEFLPASPLAVRGQSTIDRTWHKRRLPSIVRYEIRPAGGRSLLVRIQSDDRGRLAEIVADNVASIQLTAELPKGAEVDKWQPLPPSMLLRVGLVDGRQLERVVQR